MNGLVGIQKIEGDFILLTNGLRVAKPCADDYRKAEAITLKQEALFNELMRLPNSDEGHGRAASLKRQTAKLENRKHPCLRVWNAHLFPKEYKTLTGSN